MHFLLHHALSFSSAAKARGNCRKLYADEKAKLLARRRTQEQASSTAAQVVKPKLGVSRLTYTAKLLYSRFSHPSSVQNDKTIPCCFQLTRTKVHA